MPPVKPEPVGADQLYCVPAGTSPLTPSVGVTTKATPPQVVVLIGVIAAVGLIVSVTVKLLPIHDPDTADTVYLAVCGALVGFSNVPAILLRLVPDNPPVNPPVTTGTGHV